MRGLWCALLVAGCDEVWSIDHVDPIAGDASNPTACADDRHDEDGDGIADTCDRCPGIADDQADADGDSLGDACDPSASTNERIELFLSFADGDTNWNAVYGTWPLDGENLVYASVSLPSNACVLYTGVVPAPPFVLEYGYSVDAIDTVGSAFMVQLDADAAGDGLSCGHRRNVGPLRDFVRATHPQGTPADQLEIMTVTPGTYRVVAAYDRDVALRCAFAAADGSTSGAVRISLPAAVPAGALGFRSLQIGVRVHYIAIYKAY